MHLICWSSIQQCYWAVFFFTTLDNKGERQEGKGRRNDASKGLGVERDPEHCSKN